MLLERLLGVIVIKNYSIFLTQFQIGHIYLMTAEDGKEESEEASLLGKRKDIAQSTCNTSEVRRIYANCHCNLLFTPSALVTKVQFVEKQLTMLCEINQLLRKARPP